jgi:hypothetical protein
LVGAKSKRRMTAYPVNFWRDFLTGFVQTNQKFKNMKTNVSKEIVLQAIENVNKKQGYQIELNRADYTGKWFNFTIKTKSKIPGARLSFSGRNLPKCSWHAHGYLFDAIFTLNPSAIIYSFGKKITIDDGNWQDIKIGSMMNPKYFSETSIL